jgi:hypothetical protein
MPFQFEPNSGHVDHVVAKQHGGKTRFENLAMSCGHCNLHKGPNLTGIDPTTEARIDLFDPRTQVWAEHFQLRGARINGITPCGRATARTLAMNDRERIRLRARLLLAGFHDLFLR